MYVIETKNLTKIYGKQKAVDRLSLRVKKGETFGFLGANGAGKTTAIKMLCGLLDPTAGAGSVAGFDIITERKSIRRRIGYMSQKFAFYKDLTVLENLRLFGALYRLPSAIRKARTEEILETLRLGEIKRRSVGGLPAGWQQRLSLACASLHQPDILFLDEPTGSVDPISRRIFWRHIEKISHKGTTIFMTTHHMDEAEYCQRLSIMVNGGIRAIGAPPELKKQYGARSIHEAFIAVIEQSRLQSHESFSHKCFQEAND
jgi:ABC-2 type transport system ATP-binding protein